MEITEMFHGKLALLTLLSFSLVFSSCEKNPKDTPQDVSLETSHQFLKLNKVAAEIFTQSDILGKSYLEGGTNQYFCYTATSQPNNQDYYPVLVQVSYSKDCPGILDNNSREGQINAIFHDSPSNPDALIEVELVNYNFNGMLINTNVDLVNTGKNSSNGHNFSVKIESGTIQEGNKSMEWSQTLTYEWVENYDTSGTWLDDGFLVSGNISGQLNNGYPFEAEISNKLRQSHGCQYITTGDIDLYPGELFPRIISFGTNNSCDKNATIFIGLESFNIDLP